MYIDLDICKTCGGKCCKRMPGEAFPNDMLNLFGGNLEDALFAAFKSGQWVIDWWEGDPREGQAEVECGYYIRPRGLNERPALHNPSWGTTCGFLKADGCSLSPEMRPQSCRELEPVEGKGKCKMHDGGKRKAAIAWIPHHAAIENAAKKAEKKARGK